MYSPLTGKLPASSASTNILAALQRPNDPGVEPSSFSSMLQQSSRTPAREPTTGPQTQSTREPARSETRTAERQPGATQSKPESPSRADPAREQQSTAARDGAGDGAQTDTNAPSDPAAEADATKAAPADEANAASAAATAAVDPASLAELSAILAALAGMQSSLPSDPGLATPESAAGQPAAVGEGLDATLAGIEAAIDKLPKALQAAARALVGLPANEQGAGTEGTTPKAASDAAESFAALAAPAADEHAKDAKATAASSAAQVTTVTQLASTAQNQAQQAGTVSVGNGGELAAAALAQTARNGRAEAQAVQQLPVFTPAGHKAWTEDVGNRLIWMANRGESRAELVLTPPSLGKLGVSIQVSGDQTTAQFVAATPAAREALEQAMPRLREVLQQAGINLGQTDVSTSPEQQARDGQSDGRGGQRRGGSETTVAVEGLDRPLSQGFGNGVIGLVDTFA